MQLETTLASTVNCGTGRKMENRAFTRNRRRTPRSVHGPRAKRNRAFTIIEAVAVCSVLALLACTMAMGMATTRPHGYTALCLNNLRQLAYAWRMYADDNQGRVTRNRDGGIAGKTPADASWAGGWLDFSSSSDSTNINLLINHGMHPYGAYLGPYVKTASVYKCPADKSIARIAGQVFPRVRSVSMNNYFGENSRTWSGNQARFVLYSKITQVRSPANIFVFLDEREDSINDPVFLSNPDTRYSMVDYPAGYHAGAGSFAFADAHAELHKWTDPRTTPIITPGVLLPLNVLIAGDEDIDWLHQHAAERRQ